MYGQDAYKIPKVKREFQAQLNDGTKILQNVSFFLNEYSRYSKEQQSLLEFLNDDKVLIPSIRIQPGNKEVFIILNKNEICYVVDQTVHPAPSSLPQKQAVFLLNNGQTINASIYHETPKEQSRMIDFLSMDGQFVELVMDRRCFVYINKRFILEVIL